MTPFLSGGKTQTEYPEAEEVSHMNLIEEKTETEKYGASRIPAEKTSPKFGIPTGIPIITCEGREEGELFPCDFTCTMYYKCVNHKVVTLTCHSGLVFNAKLKKCDKPENVPECRGNVRIPITTPTGSSEAFTPGRGIFKIQSQTVSLPEGDQVQPEEIPGGETKGQAAGQRIVPTPPGEAGEESDCKCAPKIPVGLIMKLQSLFGDSLTTNLLDSLKKLQENVKLQDLPKSRSKEPASCKGMKDGLYPIIGNCEVYYQCAKGKRYDLTCPPNQLFSIGRNSCFPKDEVKDCAKY